MDFILLGGKCSRKSLKELDMFDILQKSAYQHIAGLILLAKEIENQNQTYFSTIPMMVKRNAYGRQNREAFTPRNEEMKEQDTYDFYSRTLYRKCTRWC